MSHQFGFYTKKSFKKKPLNCFIVSRCIKSAHNKTEKVLIKKAGVYKKKSSFLKTVWLIN